MNESLSQRTWRPLGLDSWRPSGYPTALKTASDQFEMFDVMAKSHCREIGELAILSSLARQTERNANTNITLSNDIDDILKKRALRGSGDPHEMIQVLAQDPSIESIEIARFTHVGTWNTNDAIDTPVRADLLNAPDIDTVALPNEGDTASYYKVRTFNGDSEPVAVGIERKRPVFSHVGGKVLTVIANNLLVDLHDENIPDTLKENLLESANQHTTFDYDQHVDYLRKNLEQHLREPNIDKKPRGIIPLSTIYYGTVASARDTRNRQGRLVESARS